MTDEKDTETTTHIDSTGATLLRRVRRTRQVDDVDAPAPDSAEAAPPIASAIEAAPVAVAVDPAQASPPAASPVRAPLTSRGGPPRDSRAASGPRPDHRVGNRSDARPGARPDGRSDARPGARPDGRRAKLPMPSRSTSR